MHESPGKIITFIFFVLLLFGLVMVGSASVVDAARDFSDKWYYLKLQAAWAGLGVGVFLFFSRFNHLRLQKLSPHLFIGTFILLFLVILPGIGTKLLGARRWLNFGLVRFQPSELSKITLGIYFSAFLAKNHRFVQFISVLGLVALLILLQPDMGTALVVICLGLLIYYGSNGSVWHLFSASIIGLVLVGLLIIVSPYRFSRLKTFFDFSRDPQGASYQIRQALISLGSGGVMGVGLGQSRQKYDFLPEATTDSIFAVVGEELGLFGTLALVLAFLIMVLNGLEIARNSKGFSSNLALAMTAIIGVQAFINISAITALLPLTGIPLPFISYGGSSLLTMAAAAGISVNISKSYVR